jgi:hypothetical protein
VKLKAIDMNKLLTIFFLVASIVCTAQPGSIFNGYKHRSVTVYDTIVVNFYDSASSNRGKITRPAPDLYNNYSVNLTNTTTSNNASAGLKTKDGTVTGIQLQWIANTGTVDGYSDNTGGGATPTYGSGNTLGFTDSCFQVARYSTQNNSTMKWTGLDNSKPYNMAFVVSRNNATSRPVTYTVNGIGYSVNAALNLTNQILITGIYPTSNTITITISFTATFAYCDGAKLWYPHL